MRRFVSDLKWTTLHQAAYIGINYVVLIVLTRLLSSADFGLAALSGVLIGLFEVLNGFGIPQLIIKNRVTDSARIGFYLAFCAALSTLLALLCALSGQVYVWWFGGEYRAELSAMIAVSSGGLLFNGVAAVYGAQYQRDLDFKTPALFSIVSLALGNALAVWYAAEKGDYWALVVRNLAPSGLLALGFIAFSAYRPTFRPGQRLLPEERRFTFWLSGNQIVNYLSRNLDYVVIGRFFEIGIVGQYSIAYRLMLFPMKFLSSRVQAVLYPTLARMRDNPERLMSFYVKAVSYIGFVMFPFMGLVGVTAPLWAPWVFDTERYDALLPLIQWLTVAGAFQAVTAPIGSLYLVFNMVRLMAAYTTASALVFLAGYGLGAWSGDIVAFAMIYVALSVAVNFFAANYVPLSRLNYPFGVFLRQTLEPALPAAAAYAGVWIGLTWLGQDTARTGQAFVFAAAMAVYTGMYFALYAWQFGPTLREKMNKLKTLIS